MRHNDLPFVYFAGLLWTLNLPPDGAHAVSAANAKCWKGTQKLSDARKRRPVGRLWGCRGRRRAGSWSSCFLGSHVCHSGHRRSPRPPKRAPLQRRAGWGVSQNQGHRHETCHSSHRSGASTARPELTPVGGIRGKRSCITSRCFALLPQPPGLARHTAGAVTGSQLLSPLGSASPARTGRPQRREGCALSCPALAEKSGARLPGAWEKHALCPLPKFVREQRRQDVASRGEAGGAGKGGPWRAQAGGRPPWSSIGLAPSSSRTLSWAPGPAWGRTRFLPLPSPQSWR